MFCIYPSTELTEVSTLSTVKSPSPIGHPRQEPNILLISFSLSLPSQSLSPTFFFSFLKEVNAGIEIQINIPPRHSLISLMSSHRLRSRHFNYALLSFPSSGILPSCISRFLPWFFGRKYLPGDSRTSLLFPDTFPPLFLDVTRLKTRSFSEWKSGCQWRHMGLSPEFWWRSSDPWNLWGPLGHLSGKQELVGQTGNTYHMCRECHSLLHSVGYLILYTLSVWTSIYVKRFTTV